MYESEIGTAQQLYIKLAAPFDKTFKDQRGGIQIEYITGEQCVSRLNEVLGVFGWDFDIVEHGINTEADEVWVRGKLTLNFSGYICTREQFGSQKIKRSRSTGQPLDIGFDLKGATTDCLKKCASLIGVGLYLYEKEGGVAAQSLPNDVASVPARNGAKSATGGGAKSSVQAMSVDVNPCQECNEVLKTAYRFKDGTTWTNAQLAFYGVEKFGKVLCMPCFRTASEAARQPKPTF